MKSGKIIFFLVLVLIAMMLVIGYDEVSSKANFKQEKGAIVVLIKASKSNRSVTPYRVYLRDSVGNLKDYRITNYEYSFIHLGDTIK